MSGVRVLLRDARYALPQKIERVSKGPSPDATGKRCLALGRAGIASTVGYFQASDADPDEIVAANLAIARLLKNLSAPAYLSVKAPPLRFDLDKIRTIARAAQAAKLPLLFDAHAPKDADPTLDLVDGLLSDFPETGFALPARWARSCGDAERFKNSTARVRIVKGEWPDPGFQNRDIERHYLELVAVLAGRRAPVSVATHDPELAERALALLVKGGTPCELEQLRGLPRKRTTALATRLGVPVRIYLPFGPGWWPYAFDKALGRPYLLSWLLKDRFGD